MPIRARLHSPEVIIIYTIPGRFEPKFKGFTTRFNVKVAVFWNERRPKVSAYWDFIPIHALARELRERNAGGLDCAQMQEVYDKWPRSENIPRSVLWPLDPRF